MLSMACYHPQQGDPHSDTNINVRVDAVLQELTLAEKISLLAGADNWHLQGIERLGIPQIRTSDGPNGIRGTKMINGDPASCLPCGTALAATWDVDLIRRGGQLLAEEASNKGVSVILGPTVNTPRSPLAGRGFESFGEDPVLAGVISSEFVSTVQSKGVGATLKHFVCNDQEHERMSQDSRLSERALREIYAMPFQITLRSVMPWALMTGYNKVNGTHASENSHILQDILRGEWGYEGLVMSDWRGTYSTAEAIKAGLDLEMPGPSYLRGNLVNIALTCGKLTENDIDRCVKRILHSIYKVLPQMPMSKMGEEEFDPNAKRKYLREAASSACVLLKNDNHVLPFHRERSIAIIGPNAKIAAISGGGSANVVPSYTVNPFEGISSHAECLVEYSLGCTGYNKNPLLTNLVNDLKFSVYAEELTNKSQEVLDVFPVSNSDLYLFDYAPPLPTSHQGAWYAEIIGSLEPPVTGDYSFSLSVAGTAKLFINNKLLVDAATQQKHGGGFFGYGTTEVYGIHRLTKGEIYTLRVEFGSIATSQLPGPGKDSTVGGGIRIGCAYLADPEEELAKAISIAKQVNQVAIVVGLNADWESEGFDRETLKMPGNTDRLIREITSVNKNTAVIIQSGTPITMEWVDSAPAILHAWYGGNELGNAIADVLYGEVNPSGKLPLTFPIRLEDNPAFLNYGSERGRTIYGEDIYVGYRYYEKTWTRVLFPFGHGLSYTDFNMDKMRVDVSESEDLITVSVDVQNVGNRDGAQVVQVYLSQRKPSVARPIKELKGFTKVFLASKEKKTVQVNMSLKYATSFWDESEKSWLMEQDTFDVLVGSSSADERMLSTPFDLSMSQLWKGL
ncbi:putative beta-glucosidase I [Penicillium rolfsii]|nr:putative beta-glucosidase I [Penicillium rolfsii]